MRILPVGIIDPIWDLVLLIGLIGYPLLQVGMLFFFEKRWKSPSALPLIIMIPIYSGAIYGLYQGSNLWWLIPLFISPVALGYLLLVFLFFWLEKKRENQLTANIE